MELSGKRIVLGVSGGISAYKSAELVRLLMAKGAAVDVVMTKAACQFVGPLTFQALTGNPVSLDMFDPIREAAISHIALADRADLIVVAPATADLLAKAACGICDELLPTVLLAAKCKILFVPAMNVRMWESPITQSNVARLKDVGCLFTGPEAGELACGHIGAGRMAEPEAIREAVIQAVLPKPLKGRKFVVSAGPTREPIDSVRFLSNRSSGRMGYAIARAAAHLGADVALISGPSCLPVPAGVKTEFVDTSEQMAKRLKAKIKGAYAVIMSAAVADLTPKKVLSGKPAKSELPDTLELGKTEDIVASLARMDTGAKIVGFAAQAGNAIAGGRKKLKEKKLFAIVANDISRTDIGFDTADNEVTVLFADGRSIPIRKKDKEILAFDILSALFDFSWK